MAGATVTRVVTGICQHKRCAQPRQGVPVSLTVVAFLEVWLKTTGDMSDIDLVHRD